MIPRSLLAPFGLLFTLLTGFGVLGNIFVIIAIVIDRKMRKTGLNILLLNLAIADLGNLLLNMCEWVPTVTMGRIHWVFPDLLCPICRFLEYVFLFVSITTQIIISLERYIAIVNPMHARRFCTRKKALQAVGAAWVFVGVFASPYLYHHSVKRNSMGASCSNAANLQPWWRFYKMAEFLFFYLIPCVVIIFVYTKIVRCLWAKNFHLGDNTRRTKKNDALRTRRNVIKMLLACVAVYFICYSPIQFVFISKTIFQSTYHLSYEFLLAFNALAMTCSAANPLLYTLFSMKFRRKIRSLMTCDSYAKYRAPLSSKVRESKVYMSNCTTD